MFDVASRLLICSLMASLVACGGTTAVIDQLGSGSGQPQPVAGATSAVSPVLPPTDSRPSGTPSTAQNARPTADRIISFKYDAVTLFTDRSSFNGERVPTAAFKLPIPALDTKTSPNRVQIMTVYGTRWIAYSEVQLGTETLSQD